MSDLELSEVIFALEQIKEIYGDKSINQFTLNHSESGIELFVEFKDYTSHIIAVKNTED